MQLAVQFFRIILFALFSNLAANGIGVWDADAGTFQLSVDSAIQALVGVGGFLANLGWWRWANATQDGR